MGDLAKILNFFLLLTVSFGIALMSHLDCPYISS